MPNVLPFVGWCFWLILGEAFVGNHAVKNPSLPKLRDDTTCVTAEDMQLGLTKWPGQRTNWAQRGSLNRFSGLSELLDSCLQDTRIGPLLTK